MIHVRHIAQAAAVEPTDTPPPASEATPSPFDVNPELDSDQRALVQRMLQSTVHAFASNPAGPPKPAPGVTHAIHLTDSAPIKQAGYRQSPQKTAVTSAAIERHRRSEQPDYSEARHTPEEPRPSHRYSLAPRESHPVTPTSVKKSPS